MIKPVYQDDIYLPRPAQVEAVESLTSMEKYFRFRMEVPLDEPYLPGQFMELSVAGIGEAPISITSSPTRAADGVFEMVIRDVGNVTHALHGLEPGSRVGIRGPFGTTFPVKDVLKGRDLLFVCGGIGLVPVRSAIDYVLDRREEYGRIIILSGTRRPEDRLFVDELLEWKTRDDITFIETVDMAEASWGGHVGVITTLFPNIQVEPACTSAIVCGPPIMYKFVLVELSKLCIAPENIYLSLERRMKCGVGKCGHCQINGVYACQQGPVFRYADIRQLEEAI